MEEAGRISRKVESQRQAWNTQFGDVKEIIHADFQGHRFVAIGSQLSFQPIEKTQSFPDFLYGYLGGVMGKDWGQAELAKTQDAMHTLAKWHVERATYNQTLEPDDRGLVATPLRGAAASSLHLAFDLFTLRHNAEVQEELVNRLRSPDQFQGAKYEALAASTLVRAGFEVAFEDESDGSTKHPELVATHKVSGQRLALEAKSRHWPGVLGFSGEGNPPDLARPDVRRIVNAALRKDPQFPYVVFVDLNLPPQPGPPDCQSWFTHIARLAERLSNNKTGKRARFTMLAFTNFSYHYIPMDSDVQNSFSMVGILATNPNCPIDHGEAFLGIPEWLQKYDNIPLEFPEGVSS